MSIEHEETVLDAVVRLQDGLVSRATGGTFEGNDEAYADLRRQLLADPATRTRLPSFVRRCRDLGQFWQFIKGESGTYQGRREFLWDAFRPLIDELERFDQSPAAIPIGEALEAFDPDQVHVIWQKALGRITSDPEGAITAARTLVETVCKHILDEFGVDYPDDADLPKLWSLAATTLKLSPQQHEEQVFKAILGNVQSVVNYLGTIRNRLGDAHGRGRRLPVKPQPRHAELVVNLAGTMATFLIATWKERAS